MTCDEARRAFSDLYDEVLSGAPLVTLTQHLASCPACRAEWAGFRKAMQAVADLGSDEPSPGFAARVRERAEQPALWQRLVQWLFLPLRVKVPIQAVVLLLLAFMGLLLYQRSPELRRATEPSQALAPPVAREAPASPPAVEAPATKDEGAAPPSEPLKTAPDESQASPVADLAPTPPAGSEAEKGQALAAPREEAREPGKAGAVSEAPQAAEPPQAFRARSGEPGVASDKPMPPASAPRQTPAPAPVKESRTSPAPPGPADRLYTKGVTELGRQRYAQAIDTLRTFIRQNPRDARVPEARMRLADAYVAQQRFKDAIPEYEALVRDFPESPLIPAALYGQAQARLAAGDQAGCTLLRDLLDRYPQSPEAAAAREALSTRCR